MSFKYNYEKEWVNNNFDIHSFKVSDLRVVKHILKNNTLSNNEAKDESKLNFKNLIIAGKTKSYSQTIQYIKKLSNEAIGSNKFPFKVIVSTLNLKPQEPENQEIIKKWAEHQIQSWKNKGIEIIISAVHLNETSVNLHIIANNTRKENNKILFGWGFKKIKLDDDLQKEKDEYLLKLENENLKLAKEKKPLKRIRKDNFGTFETKQLHRNQERELEIFCREFGLVYKQQATTIKGKSLSIQEYKNLYKDLNSEAIKESSNLIQELTEQLAKQNNLIASLNNDDDEILLKEIQKRDEIILKLKSKINPKGKIK